MNQILVTRLKKSSQKKKLSFFRFAFFISIFFIVSCVIYISYLKSFKKSRDATANYLINSYTISNLYGSTNFYFTDIPSTTPNDLEHLDNSEPPIVIGIIRINKLNFSYPVLSYLTDEFLKISVCRFYGPNLNEVGNVCIAGHNYNDGSFFSSIYSLNYGDSIFIVSNNEEVEYIVYNKKEVNYTDTSCTEQNTDGKREITLVTCNNFNGYRIVISAKEKDLIEVNSMNY